MSFVQSRADPAARAKAVIVVGGVHALLGAGLVLGLTFTGVIQTDDHLPTTIFEVDDPETLPPPPDTVEPDNSYIPPVAPPRPFDFSNTPPVDPLPLDPPVDAPTNLLPIPQPTPTLAPSRPTPPPAFDPVAAIPRNGPLGWITNEDYPRQGITRELEGSARYRLVIGSDGRVDECQIVSSTGHTVLDRTTCQLIERRARFDAAKDETGRTVVGTFSGQVTWELPD